MTSVALPYHDPHRSAGQGQYVVVVRYGDVVKAQAFIDPDKADRFYGRLIREGATRA